MMNSIKRNLATGKNTHTKKIKRNEEKAEGSLRK